MALAMTAMNYLVQITVIGTSNPAVTRLLSIPVTATFDALHRAVEGSLGWKGHGYDVGPYSFRIIGEDPSTWKRHHYTGSEPILAIPECNSDECGFDCIGDAPMVQLHQVFDSYEYREQVLQHVYNGEFGGPVNALQVFGRTTIADGRNTVCLGGQGESSIRAWYKAEDVGKATPSSWDLDLDKVNERMAKLRA